MEQKIPERNVYQFLDYLDRYLPNPAVIVELGARDCTETAVLSHFLPNTQVYAFECNPATLPICRKISSKLPNAKLIEKAATNKNGTISFFAIDPEKTKTTWKDGNPGASSLLQASGKYPIEKYVQKKITVDATRLDSFIKKMGVAQIDALMMDIQGGELMALESTGQELKNIKLIYTEVEFFEIYNGQPLFIDIYDYLNKKGFFLIGLNNPGEYSADAVFINKSLLKVFDKLKAYFLQGKLIKQSKTRVQA